MSFSTDDTIAAVASPQGGAMRGIVRVSGPQTIACLVQCFDGKEGESLREIRSPRSISGVLKTGSVIGDLPCELYLWPGIQSYTRQPAAEIHTFGSPPLLEAVLKTLCASGARLAEPGEFTLRAFLAGRLDLTQAEAVLGVIDATDHAQLNVALEQLAGGLAGPLSRLREQLLDLLAHLEAGLDFVDEDIQFIAPDELDRQLESAAAEIDQIARQLSQRGEATEEFRVVLMGCANVGKSSLINALSGQRSALVSPTPGTTRDYVARRVDFDGVSCLLIDTAGVEANGSSDRLATAAQSASDEQRQRADLQVLCLDATRPLDDWEREELQNPDEKNIDRLIVLTKIDAQRNTDFSGPAIETSSQSGFGLDDLRRAIHRRLTDSTNDSSSAVVGTAARCRESLDLASTSLAEARNIASEQLGEELVAAEVRHGLDELGKVVGAVYTDDVLDRIFGRFCIGK